MHTTFTTAAADRGRAAAGPAGQSIRFVVQVGETPCEIRARTVADVAEVLGFEAEMDHGAGVLQAGGTDERVVVDMLESRMIVPPRPRRRGGRALSSRALFYGVGG